jgi:serine/threonine-protein kinase ULK/ATG1
MEAEYNAVTCVAVYMLLMSFSQKGIDKLRNFQEHMKMRHPEGDFVVSDGFEMGPHACFLLVYLILITFLSPQLV